MVSVDSLVIDDGESVQDYQRGERHAFTEWDWGKYDPIRVGRRGDGTNHVIEGGHRVRQARRFGITHLPAFVMSSCGASHEAIMFSDIASSRKGLKARERFKAAVVAGDPRSVSLHRTLAKYGLSIGCNEWPNVRSVTSLLRINADVLDFALGVICEVWHGDTDALREPIIIGLCGLVLRFRDRARAKLDRDRLIARLRVVSPIVIVRETSCTMTGDKMTRFGDVFERLYTKHTRKPGRDE